MKDVSEFFEGVKESVDLSGGVKKGFKGTLKTAIKVLKASDKERFAKEMDVDFSRVEDHLYLNGISAIGKLHNQDLEVLKEKELAIVAEKEAAKPAVGDIEVYRNSMAQSVNNVIEPVMEYVTDNETAWLTSQNCFKDLNSKSSTYPAFISSAFIDFSFAELHEKVEKFRETNDSGFYVALEDFMASGGSEREYFEYLDMWKLYGGYNQPKNLAKILRFADAIYHSVAPIPEGCDWQPKGRIGNTYSDDTLVGWQESEPLVNLEFELRLKALAYDYGDHLNPKGVEWLMAHIGQKLVYPGLYDGRAIVFYGKGGVGKSEFVEVILSKIFGEANITRNRNDDFFTERFASTGTESALYIGVEESRVGKVVESHQKSFTGSKTRLIEVKGLSAFEVPNFSTLVINTNENTAPVAVSGTDDSINRRWSLFDVTQSSILEAWKYLDGTEYGWSDWKELVDMTTDEDYRRFMAACRDAYLAYGEKTGRRIDNLPLKDIERKDAADRVQAGYLTVVDLVIELLHIFEDFRGEQSSDPVAQKMLSNGTDGTLFSVRGLKDVVDVLARMENLKGASLYKQARKELFKRSQDKAWSLPWTFFQEAQVVRVPDSFGKSRIIKVIAKRKDSDDKVDKRVLVDMLSPWNEDNPMKKVELKEIYLDNLS